jgi:hypothetical protein
LVAETYSAKGAAINVAERWRRATSFADAAVFAPFVPSELALSVSDGRQLALATAAVMDLADLRYGADLRKLLVPLLPTAFSRVPAAPPAPVAPAAPAAPPVAAAAPEVKADLEVIKKRLAEVEALHGHLAGLKTELDKKSRELDRRMKKLEG